MYPLLQVRDATNQLWSAVRASLGWGPEELEWDKLTPHVWHEPDLLLAQCCGWPLVAELPESMVVVGVFDYDVPNSINGSYQSVIVTGTDRSLDDLRRDPGVVAAVNGLSSLSGWISLQHVWGGREQSTIVTGSHIESVRAVAAGSAQLASIDAVSWSLLEEFEPAAVAGLRVVGQGPRVPCLPIVVPAQFESKVAELRAAFAAAVADPALVDARRAMRIRGFVPLDRSDYTPLLTLLA